ncbi:MAG: response regulator transcription factor [Chloroflexi bacterium]|nr:response regulator transcription factor [Chloroflexota bacterium]
MTEPIRLLVADDHALFRRGVLQTLNTPEMTVVAEATTAAEALEKARETLPDVLLLDVSMPGGSGLDILPQLQAEVPICKVVILTVSEDEETLFLALKQGARGYIVKGVTADDLVAAVQAVHSGETYVAPGMAGRILTEMAKNRPAGLPDLSAREQEILERIAQGQTNKEIAAELYLSEKTIKHYVTNILTKLQVRNRVEAALKARAAERAT